MKRITQRTLEQVRELLHQQTNESGTRKTDLYDIFSAIRGPDREDQRDLKYVTIAIRAYMGFDFNNCTGALGDSWSNVSVSYFEKLLDTIMRARNLDDDANHYQRHLKYAVQSIGRKNLIDFVRKRAGMPLT